MKIALIGYGKMVKEIERLALERTWGISARVDIGTPPATSEQRKQTDAAIHFASAGTLIEDIEPWAKAGVPLVIGTTGWQERFGNVAELVRSSGIGLIYSSNFSLGVNVFFHLVREASRTMERFPEYDPSIHETHHKDKADSPSGTALTMGKIVLEEISRKKELLTVPPAGKIRPEQLHISSTRTGSVVGTHTLTFDSIADSLELKHNAKNRTGFALGALLAAEWIVGKKGVFTMEDVAKDLFKGRK